MISNSWQCNYPNRRGKGAIVNFFCAWLVRWSRDWTNLSLFQLTKEERTWVPHQREPRGPEGRWPENSRAMTIKCQIHLQKVFAMAQLAWLYGARLAHCGWHLRCFDGFGFYPTGMTFSKLLAPGHHPGHSLGLFHPQVWRGMFLQVGHSGHRDDPDLWSSQRQFPAVMLFHDVDMEVTRPNREVI